jgi:hypothetical protein
VRIPIKTFSLNRGNFRVCSGSLPSKGQRKQRSTASTHFPTSAQHHQKRQKTQVPNPIALREDMYDQYQRLSFESS